MVVGRPVPRQLRLPDPHPVRRQDQRPQVAQVRRIPRKVELPPDFLMTTALPAVETALELPPPTEETQTRLPHPTARPQSLSTLTPSSAAVPWIRRKVEKAAVEKVAVVEKVAEAEKAVEEKAAVAVKVVASEDAAPIR